MPHNFTKCLAVHFLASSEIWKREREHYMYVQDAPGKKTDVFLVLGRPGRTIYIVHVMFGMLKQV